MKIFKTPLTIRSDFYSCPLSLQIDTYYGCEPDCHHCFFRGLNYVWGTDIRMADPEDIRKKLESGLKNKTPKSPLANALKQKKTIRIGSKSDPLQPINNTYYVTQKVMGILKEMSWDYVLQTRFTENIEGDLDLILGTLNVTILPVISPGWDKDWEIFEKKITTHPDKRLKFASFLNKRNINVGINGEPFIPGYHTINDFEDSVKRIKSAGIKSYNTYNFHFTPFVAKRLASIGIDVVKIWETNQDKNWYPIQQKLIEIAKKYDIILGCPDYVNSGWGYRQQSNTCCGMDVKNPLTFNTHTWKKLLQDGNRPEDVLEKSWDGVGNKKEGENILTIRNKKTYTILDIKE